MLCIFPLELFSVIFKKFALQFCHFFNTYTRYSYDKVSSLHMSRVKFMLIYCCRVVGSSRLRFYDVDCNEIVVQKGKILSFEPLMNIKKEKYLSFLK